MNFNIIHKIETTSTNDEIKLLLSQENPREFTTVYADFQTQGRGQRGNQWKSTHGQNLLFSTLLKPLFLKANKQFTLSQIAALCVKKTLDEFTEGISIKWPNDVYWHEKKICGMLIEIDLADVYVGSCILGIGININQTDMNGSGPNPISLIKIINKEVDLKQVLDLCLQHLDEYYTLLKSGNESKIQKDYCECLFRKEGLHPFTDSTGTFNAHIQQIDPNGMMHLQLENGEIRQYAFKEVKYVIDNNKI